MKNKKVYIYLIIILVVVLIIGIAYKIILDNKEKNVIKNFDINDENIQELNDTLDNIEKGLTEKDENFKSKKSINNDVQSLLITINKENSFYYQAYNISTKDNRVLNYKEVLEIYGYKLQDVYDKIKERLHQLYLLEFDEGYIDNECDEECYLDYYRGMTDIESSFAIYISNERVIIYFDLLDIDEDKEFFDNLDFIANEIVL